MVATALLLLLVSVFFQAAFAAYQIVQDYSGDAFWQGFDFFTDPDPTDGLVQFQSLEAANSSGIAGFIDGGNASFAIYMGVDTEKVAPEGRAAVRVTSSQSFQHGLVIADIVHMPGGVCGTWPAFWMVGSDWPNNGEIDIVEGVNDQPTNSMTLHTSEGPVISDRTDFSGQVITSNCDINAPDQPMNAGCSIGDISNLTFGPEFNEAGGGVFATEWSSDFIKIWFFPRGSFPSDIVSSSPNPSANWGTPNSLFQGQFNIDDHFRNLQIVFDTTFCGQWAGAAWDTSTCASLAPTCEEYVANNPADFADAYWAINTLQVFQDDGAGSGNVNANPGKAKRGAAGTHILAGEVFQSRSAKAILPIYL
ncbi:putative glycosidase C21B10.07 [Cladophialophora carrionii]|uniref:endo-1,3(4)-beta-glucanase n=1 Tax=Cladophialophora carrionii TaxID=86049 RepID=A0A1C1CVW2_9EURO|nr:putative glycosidase C21B10.07 [Cladophialophora carrionii]